MTQSPLPADNDKQLAYLDTGGNSPALLLIHGVMVSGEMYQPVLPILSKHYRVIVPDLRGHGRSGSLPGPYHVEQLARDVAQLLDDLQIDSVNVLGYSQGGVIAQQFAHDYPKRVSSLILACTFAYNMLTSREQLEGMLSPWLIRILGVRQMGRLAIENSGGQRMFPETVRWLQEIIAVNEKAHMVAAIKAMLGFDGRTWLHQVTCPTLVIAGAEDEAVPLAHAQMLTQGIPHAQLHVIDGAGHFMIFTHKDIFIQAVEAFLTSVNR